MGEQGIILSCLLRLKTSCRFEFPHLCLQCTTHYSFISFLTATAEKKPLEYLHHGRCGKADEWSRVKTVCLCRPEGFLTSWIAVRFFSEIGFLTTDHRDNLIISTIESVLTAELGEIMSIVVWQWLAENVA